MSPRVNVIVKVPSFAALQKLAGQIAGGTLYLARDLEQKQFALIVVDVETPDDERFALVCEVLQVMAGVGTALTIKPDARDAVNALLAHAMKSNDGDASAALEIVIEEPEEDAPSADNSVAHQVAEMSINEKRQAALHGNKDMRMWILKDHNKTLHPFVMKNPGLAMDEIEAASRMTSVHPDVLHLIAKDWSRSANVVRNLVKNPKTPLPDAIGLVDKLAQSDLRAIVKGGAVRGAVLTAARKRLIPA